MKNLYFTLGVLFLATSSAKDESHASEKTPLFINNREKYNNFTADYSDDDTTDSIEENDDLPDFLEDSWEPDQNEEGGGIGTGSGSLNKNIETASNVINLAGLTKPTTHLCTQCGVEISLTGKTRTDFVSAVNTKYFNNQNFALDAFNLERSTFDWGIAASTGRQSIYQKEVISLAADFRSRFVWGQPEKIASTTVTSIDENGVNTGAHNHSIGVPVLYLRGLDLTLDLNTLFCTVPDHYPTQRIKLGLFPVEIGRGISLGAAYAVTPDVLSYAPSDVIQEFAPGIMLYGTINERKTLDYRLYLSILKNNSASHSDLIPPIRNNFYQQGFFPYRGTGVLNLVGACQVDWKCIGDGKNKAIISPYIVIGHEGAGKIEFPEDSISNIVTYGMEFAAENADWSFDCEFALNGGSQYVFGLDRNTLKKEQRLCPVDGNPNTTIGVIVNDKVIFNGYESVPESSTTDIINKTATFLGAESKRQKAILQVPQSSLQNGKIITVPGEDYTLKNALDRFRDPYQNFFNGFMFVIDLARNIYYCDQLIKWSFAAGYASGDNHPNKALISKNDQMENGTYSGYIGIQEIYSGSFVRSAFLMQGSGKMPRIASVPGAVIDEITGQITESIEFPSPISGFNNLIYTGTSINFTYNSPNNDFNWKWYPNLLFYWQPNARDIYNPVIAKKLGKETINPFLGTEVNLFLEIISKHLEGFKFFVVGTIFVPGGYYKDLSQIPLDKKQEAALNHLATTFTPLISTNNAYYLNFGIEFKF